MPMSILKSQSLSNLEISRAGPRRTLSHPVARDCDGSQTRYELSTKCLEGLMDEDIVETSDPEELEQEQAARFLYWNPQPDEAQLDEVLPPQKRTKVYFCHWSWPLCIDSAHSI